MIVRHVEPDTAIQLWDDMIWPMLKDAAALDPLVSEEGVLGRIARKEAVLFAVEDNDDVLAVFTVEVDQCDKGACCTVPLLSGNTMEKWGHLVEEAARKTAQQNNCKFIQMVGRRGWLKVLKAYGWKEDGVIMSAEVSQ